MLQKLIRDYYHSRLRRTEETVNSHQRFAVDLAHEIFDLKLDSPELIGIYNSVQDKLQRTRDKLSRLQQICRRYEPVRQSS